MTRQLSGIVAIVVACFLVSCAGTAPHRQGAISWDGLGRDPNLPAAKERRQKRMSLRPIDGNSEREKVLTALRPYSEAWWVVHEAIEAENDRQLSARLVICQGCIGQSLPQELAGSIR
jgi:hypothetical protein